YARRQPDSGTNRVGRRVSLLGDHAIARRPGSLGTGREVLPQGAREPGVRTSGRCAAGGRRRGGAGDAPRSPAASPRAGQFSPAAGPAHHASAGDLANLVHDHAGERMIRMPAWRRGLLLGLLGSMASCVGAGPEPSPKRTPLPAAVCPLTPVSAARAPETLPHHEDVEFWLRDAPEEPLLSAEQIQALNAAAYRLEAGPRPLDARDVDVEDSLRAIEHRITSMSATLQEGRWREQEPGSFARAVATARSSTPVDHIRLVRDE